MNTCTATESEEIEYLVCAYCGPFDKFANLAEARAAHKRHKRNGQEGEFLMVTTKTITIRKTQKLDA